METLGFFVMNLATIVFVWTFIGLSLGFGMHYGQSLAGRVGNWFTKKTAVIGEPEYATEVPNE